MNQEIALLIAHILILTAREKTGIPFLCKTVSMALQITFMAAFSFMALEALQTYAIMTSVINSGGYFSRFVYFLIGWGGCGAIAAVSIVFGHEYYVSVWSCWLNLGSLFALTTVVPVAILCAATLVMTEAATMEDFPHVHGHNMHQRTAAIANQKAMLIILPVNVSSWLSGLIAVYFANLAMYSLVSTLNMLLGIAIFVFHSLGNPKVHAIFKETLSRFLREK